MNFWKAFALALTGVAILAIPTRAEINPNGQSVLCKQKGWLTEIAISSPEFVVAICIDKNLPGNINSYELTPTHYVGQNKDTGGKIILPLSNSHNIPGEPAFYKAVNGQYTYQVYVSTSVTLSVFKNGQRIYKYETDKYLSGWK